EERRVFPQEIGRDQERRPGEDRQVHPRLPVTNGPRWDEEQEAHGDGQREEREPRLASEIRHVRCSCSVGAVLDCTEDLLRGHPRCSMYPLAEPLDDGQKAGGARDATSASICWHAAPRALLPLAAGAGGRTGASPLPATERRGGPSPEPLAVTR